MKHVCGAIHEITESVRNDLRSRIKLVLQLNDKIDRLSQRRFCSHVSVDEPARASLAPEFTVCDLLLSSFALVNDTEASVRTLF